MERQSKEKGAESKRRRIRSRIRSWVVVKEMAVEGRRRKTWIEQKESAISSLSCLFVGIAQIFTISSYRSHAQVTAQFDSRNGKDCHIISQMVCQGVSGREHGAR